ncbi:sulfatase family protein [Aquimarina aggregata]|uniref:sulfatase family protein n=1 Tax=Aquimarina aggregata TaxID=1642818 RepID=UPI002491CA33|nr:sulfatase [Aquimarina aggregata]
MIQKPIYITIFLITGIMLFNLSCNSKEENKAEVSKTDKLPNVLIIYPDQLRRYSAGFWSEDKYSKQVIGKPDPVLTPNMDKLAKNGVVFTQAVSNFPLCSPARGMILTGMYPEQNGIWNNCRNDRDDSLKDDVPAITDVFYEAGYNTAYFGKCHWLKNEPLFDEKGTYKGITEKPGGHHMNRYDTYIPPGKSRHSIEYFYQSIRDIHYEPLVYSNDPNAIMGKKDGELHQPKIFSPKNESEKIISYLKNVNEVRNPEKPFFMMWSINPPHNPWNDENTDMEVLRKHYNNTIHPADSLLAVRDNVDLEVASYVRHYFANVTSVDYYVGEVLETLKKMGELENTIVVVSSDHGEMMGSHGRKGKNAFETESLGVPFIVHWPKSLKGGQINDVLFSVPDVMPTLLAVAGLEENIPAGVQGKNFSSLLKNSDSKTVQKPEGVLLMLGNSRGVLTDRYTLCLRENKKPWDAKKSESLETGYIYDSKEDPYQLNKISLSDKPEIAEKLLNILAKELKRTNDPWYQEKKYDSIIPYTL